MTSNEDLKPLEVRLDEHIKPTAGVFTPKLWQTYSFAPEWYGDARREATQSGHNARRREIVFAVCAAESYIFEWVRDNVLRRDYDTLNQYFSTDPQKWRAVEEKFRDVPKELHKDGRLPAPLHCGGREFADFQSLVVIRNGLVHARASRPQTTGQPDNEKPVPSKTELDNLPTGWACEVVRVLLMKLHYRYRDTTTAVVVRRS